jgi:hypothetical protein
MGRLATTGAGAGSTTERGDRFRPEESVAIGDPGAEQD